MSATKAVLYVEDAPTIRELSALALEDAGFEVVVAENGTAALNALDDHAHTFCAVVTDVNPGPGSDGWEVAKRARQSNRALTIVYVTGAVAHEWLTRSVPNSRMLSKPFTPARIVEAVSEYVCAAGNK
jgi:CheY-like chemotaxis protein